jgi:hypothetical protein
MLGMEQVLLLFFFFLAVLGFEFGAFCLQRRRLQVHFALVILEMVSQTICLGWPGTKIFLISASPVIRITDLSHWCQAIVLF